MIPSRWDDAMLFLASGTQLEVTIFAKTKCLIGTTGTFGLNLISILPLLSMICFNDAGYLEVIFQGIHTIWWDLTWFTALWAWNGIPLT
jgi:hypothetical protein